MAKQAKAVYQDFIISDASSITFTQLLRQWLGLKVRRNRAGYGTRVRRVGKQRVEVTFELPPAIRRSMQRAVDSGRHIRLITTR